LLRSRRCGAADRRAIHAAGHAGASSRTRDDSCRDPRRWQRAIANGQPGRESSLSPIDLQVRRGHRRAGVAQYLVQSARRADRQHAGGSLLDLLTQRPGCARVGSHDHPERKPMRVLRNVTTGASTVGELMHFLWARRLWWLIPFVVTLLLIGTLLVIGQVTGV